MNITFPPILIPLGLLALVYILWTYWLPSQVQVARTNTGYSRKAIILELVGIPLVGLVIVGVGFHLTGNDRIFSEIAHGLVWCVQGLIWDMLHPFAYGFSLTF